MKTLTESMRDYMGRLVLDEYEVYANGDDSKGLDITSIIDELNANPSFKRWFRGSQVVDNTGMPLICYHGRGGGYLEKLWGFSHLGSFQVSTYFMGAGGGMGSDWVGAYFLNIKNPFKIPDLYRHSLINYMKEMRNQNLISYQEEVNVLMSAIKLIVRNNPEEMAGFKITPEIMKSILDENIPKEVIKSANDYCGMDDSNTEIGMFGNIVFCIGLSNTDVKTGAKLEARMLKPLIPILKKHGIDGFEYGNDVETAYDSNGQRVDDTEDVCWIPLESRQIVPVAKFITKQKDDAPPEKIEWGDGTYSYYDPSKSMLDQVRIPE